MSKANSHTWYALDSKQDSIMDSGVSSHMCVIPFPSVIATLKNVYLLNTKKVHAIH